MATQTASHAVAHEAPRGFIRRCVFSLDHKVIGMQYLFLALVSVFVGMFLSLMVRAQLAFPEQMFPLYQRLFSDDTAGRLDYCGPQNFIPTVDTLYHNEGDGRFRDVSAASGITSVIPVSVAPGQTQLTVMPRLASSIASERVRPTTPCFAAV